MAGMLNRALLAAAAYASMLATALLTLRWVIAGARRGEHGAFALLSVQAALLVWTALRLME